MKHVRHGFGSLRPYLCGPAELVGFLETVFGARELERHAFSAESFHVELAIGDAVLALEAGPMPPDVTPWIGSVYVYVEEVDATYARAIAGGASSMAEPEDKPYGERQAGFKDVAGNTWWVGSMLAD